MKIGDLRRFHRDAFVRSPGRGGNLNGELFLVTGADDFGDYFNISAAGVILDGWARNVLLDLSDSVEAHVIRDAQ